MLARSNHKQISSKNFEQILFNNNYLFSKPSIIAESSTQKKKLHDTSINSTKDIKITQATDLADSSDEHNLLLFSENISQPAPTIPTTEEVRTNQSAAYKYLCAIS